MAIAMEIYEKIRYYREHTDYSQRNVAKILGVSRNTVKKYWEGQTVPWERKPGSGRKNDIITDEVKAFIIKCIESDKKAPRKQHHTAHKIYERLVAEYGFEGCEASVRRTVAELRCNIHDIMNGSTTGCCHDPDGSGIPGDRLLIAGIKHPHFFQKQWPHTIP